MQTHLTRRSFVKTSTAAAAGMVILRDSRSVASYYANEKLNIAIIGAGGQGGSNLGGVGKENIVAICDVDQRRAAAGYKKFPEAKQFVDFRKMLDQFHRQFEAVVVSTPDHTHAVAAVAAMKLGKHVYCEKPLARTVHEARVMRLTAREHKVMTQMGNQGSATEGLRRAVELAWAGTVGDLRQCHIWLAGGNGPQERPKEQPPVPPELDWDLWLGPAPFRPYHPTYVPGSWRAWRAFGSGSGGDMGCHTANMAIRALRLDLLWNPEPAAAPATPAVIRIEAEASELCPETYPRRITAKFDFPARGNLPPVKLTWYNGGLKPPKEVMLGYMMTEWGCLVSGDKGAILSSCPWNTRFVMLPREKFEAYEGQTPDRPASAPRVPPSQDKVEKIKGPAPTIPRVKGHHAEWIDACKGGPKPFSNFDIGGPLAEIIQLVHVATLAGRAIEYDPVSGKIVNSAEANQLLHREYRTGWTL